MTVSYTQQRRVSRFEGLIVIQEAEALSTQPGELTMTNYPMAILFGHVVEDATCCGSCLNMSGVSARLTQNILGGFLQKRL